MSLPIRLARTDEDGLAFIDWLDRRVEPTQRRRLIAFIEEWDHLRDDLGANPTVKQYAERWSVPVPTAYRMLTEFRQAVPGEDTPDALVSMLWDGMPRWDGTPGRFVPAALMRVKVTEDDK